MRSHVLPLLVLLAAPAAGQPADPPVTVQLSSFAFAPSTITLRAGEPVALRLVNRGSGGHNFAAPAFFAAARLDPRSSALVRRGAVEVGSRKTVEVRLVPAAGRYRLRCTHLLHSTFGMTGEIVVE
jgi:plastocyanin